MSENKNKKIWIGVGVAAVLVIGTLAPVLKGKASLYKGLDVLAENGMASVLTAGREEADPGSTPINVLDFMKLQTENEKRIQAEKTPGSSTDITAAPKTVIDMRGDVSQENSASCAPGETALMYGGVVVACTTAQSAPAPSVTPSPAPQPEAPQPATCESQGLFTYTGSDQAGLLYGMCIQCTTDIYLNTGGKCK